MKRKIKSIVDQVLVEQDNQYQVLDMLLDLIIPYALLDYHSCREVLQETIGQLERITSIAVPFLFSRISSKLDSYIIEKGRPAFLDYIDSDWNGDPKELMKKIEPYLGSGGHLMYERNMAIAEALTTEERRFIASSFTRTIQEYGKKTQWTNETCQDALLFCYVLYPIYKRDGVLSLLFHTYNNILDRLNTSGNSQPARDIAEGLLVIGYNERMVAEGYFSACRAYTGANNVIAGLLFYYICLYSISTSRRNVNERFAFDLCWQYIKLCRLGRIYPSDDINRVEAVVKQLQCEDYERVSFYHTLFTTQLMAKESNTLVEDVLQFLDMNREAYFKQLDHGAMPWLSLFFGMEEVMPNGDFNGLKLYANAAFQVARRDGNTMLLDLFEEKNLASHLRELQFKLQETRNRSDYTMDNRMAMIMAKKIITQAFESNNATDFLLAMSTKTDFSTVLPVKEAEGFFKQFSLIDAPGEELGCVFDSIEILTELLALEENDAILWIGCGKKDYQLILLINGKYEKLGIVSEVSHQERIVLESKIKLMKYEKDVKKPGQPIYTKSLQDFAEEDDDLKENLAPFSFAVSTSLRRLVLVKDLEIASYPHNLFCDSTSGLFIGALCPTCNGVSTEVLIKTNTLEPLSKDYTKAFWIPYGSDEFTFDMIYSKLVDVIARHHISVQNEVNQDKPLIGDMTLLCAHGGDNISSTELFYVDDKPIMDTLRFVGSGKVSILLICYSGTISQSNFDSAMHTLIKKMLLKGYSSVVAPMWSLATDIITPWLSVFLDSMERGDYIIDAVYQANMTLKREFVAASAWACLHLFGNPYLRIAEKPRVSIEMDKNGN